MPVLIVEDERAVRQFMKSALTKVGLTEGQDFVMPESATDAAEYIRSGRFSIVFMDLNLSQFEENRWESIVTGRTLAKEVQTGVTLVNISSQAEEYCLVEGIGEGDRDEINFPKSSDMKFYDRFAQKVLELLNNPKVESEHGTNRKET